MADTLFNALEIGNATYAGGLAAVVVNIVLAAYIVAAFLEDDSEPKAQPKPDAKKDQ